MADLHRCHRTTGRLAGAALAVPAVLVSFALLGPSLAGAQAPPDTVEAAPDSAAPPGPNTRGAFIRGVVLPGWGHTVSGATGRGAFYFGAESLAAWMLFKTRRRLTAAREQAGLLETHLAAELAAQGMTDPEEVEQALEADDEIARARGLVSAREDQQEDWLAPVIFIMLVSGVDAFVSAHLQDFPEPLTIEGDPSTGRVEVGIRMPLGRKRPRPGATPPTRKVRVPRTWR